MSWQQWIGVELDEVSRGEKVISLLGGFLGILLLAVLCVNGRLGSPLLLASLGASAVLLFAAPHGQLSQPWPVVAGQTLSAFIGVTSAQLIPQVSLAAAVAVGVAIGAMHQLKCLHPPGGATALTAVVGGPTVTEMGYAFLGGPVFVPSLLLVLFAVVFNYPFPWRRYPAAWNRRPPRPAHDTIPHEDIVHALRSLNSFVDITEDDLARLVEFINAKRERQPPSAAKK